MRHESKRLLSLRPLLLFLLTTGLIGATARTTQAQTESRKSPWAALGLSFLIPGGGQAYNGQWAKGGLMLGGAALFAVPVLGELECGLEADDECGGVAFTVGVIGLFGIVAWSLIDAPITAKAINRRIDAGGVALEIGPRLIVPNRDSRVGLSLVRVRF